MTEIQQLCVNFGRELLATGDLDPLYMMLATAELPRGTLGRFLLAYGMFYHAGVAAKLSIAPDFWPAVTHGVDKFPRGTERRHFRGKLASESIARMIHLTPENVLKVMYPYGDSAFQSVFKGVQRFHGWGAWIAFKMADIAERTGYHFVDFAGCELSVYEDPTQGAALWRYGDTTATFPRSEVGEVCEEVREALGADLLAPPLYDRPINIQEVETVLCKFKSHLNGHYPIGKDTHEITAGLQGWGLIADKLAACPLL